MTTPLARRLVISGRVQGVWYRNWTVKTATELNLVGWVRNMADGTVEAHVEGMANAIERFITLAYDGPLSANVSDVNVQNIEPEGQNSFEKRPDG